MAAPPDRAPIDPPEARALREALIARLVAAGEIRDPRVVAAMRDIPRHLFVPAVPLDVAYGDHPVPIGWNQTISQPTIVGIMSEALELRGDERVLEIGTGSGYQCAILSRLAREVFSVERIPELGRATRALLEELGCDNVHARVGDGYRGWPEEAPFERVVLTAAPPAIPEALVAQLADGGVLVSPVGEAPGGAQRLFRGRKFAAEMRWEDLGRVSFVPMIGGAGTTWS